MRGLARGLLLACVLLCVWIAPAAAAPPDRATALDQWLTIREAMTVPAGWTGSRATCTRGAESPTSIAATLYAVNALRDFAGLGAVSFDPVLNDRALAAALIMHAGNALSHGPAASWPCYTGDGAIGAAHSNLYLGASGAKAMVGYVNDNGVASLGHRRWMLDRTAATFGTGSTGATNALYVIADTSTPPRGPSVVSWPPPGWVPWSLVFPDWSAEFPDDVDLSGARVSVSIDGRPVSVGGLRRLTGRYGSGGPTLTWTVAIDAQDRAADRTLDVTIDGLARNGAPYPYRSSLRTFPADPPQPVTVTVTYADGVVTTAWDAAVERGLPVTGYRVVVTRSDGTVLVDTTVGPDVRTFDFPPGDETGGLMFAVTPLSRGGTLPLTMGGGSASELLSPGSATNTPPVSLLTTRRASATPTATSPRTPTFTRAVRIQRPKRVRPGRRLVADARVRDAVKVTYQWLRNGRTIRGATTRRFTVRRADRGRRLSCRVTAVGTATRVVRTSGAVRVAR